MLRSIFVTAGRKSVTGSRGAVLKTMRMDDASGLVLDQVKTLKAPYRAVLTVIHGNEMGHKKRLEGTILVGRDPAAGLMLTDARVSWHHARVEDRGDAWAVVDLNSTNGTLVNGKRITECVLPPNAKIKFGSTVVRFEVQDPTDQAYDGLLEQMLNVDDLSGLFVRRKFDADLKVLLEASKTQQQPLGLLMMDLDGVKKINDTHGHLFGAYVIGEAGKCIGEVIRGRGIGSRFGGDEYIAALPDLTLDQTVLVGQEILEAISNYHFEREGILLHPGISIGAASFPESAQDQLSLFQRADEALYRAKQTGKNRVCT